MSIKTRGAKRELSRVRKQLAMPIMNRLKMGHVLDILNEYENKHLAEPHRNIPLDAHLRYYFLDHKKQFSAIDSLDREHMVDYVYTLMRWKTFLNVICQRPMTWESRLKAFLTPEFERGLEN
jgi:hypothetical protein